MEKKINNTHLVITFGLALLLLTSVVATAGMLSAGSNNFAALAQESDDDFSAETIDSGNYIINYIYEIEVEGNNSKIKLDSDMVEQGDGFEVNGTEFHADEAVSMSIHAEQLLSITNEDGDAAERSAAALLTATNVTLSEEDGDVTVENSELSDSDNNGTVVLVTNISPSDVSFDEYSIGIECEEGPGDDTSFEFADPLLAGNSSSKQFFELELPAGDYEQCNIVMTPGEEDDDNSTVETSSFNLTITASAEEDDNSTTNDAVELETTDSEGSFIQDIAVASDASPGRYVLMAETADSTDEEENEDKKMAIASLSIVEEGTSTASDDDVWSSSGQGGGNGNSGGSSDAGSDGGEDNSSTTNPSTDTSVGGSNGGGEGGGNYYPPDNTTGGNTGGEGDNSGSQGPPAPPPDTGGNGNTGGEDNTEEDTCEEAMSGGSGTVNNTIVQSSAQSAANNYTDDDVINVVQKISGTYNGTGHVNNSIAIDNSNTVKQGVNQDIDQDASIKKCGDMAAEGGGNQTNTIDMNSSQLASNVYSDNTTIVIVQTIIIPKHCNTNVNTPIEISDKNTVTQTIDQDAAQDGEINYGSDGSGSNTNTVNQVTMQVAVNNATNDQVITINQVIIVPNDCPVEIHAPIVINDDDNVDMVVSQTSEQDGTINSGAPGGVTIASTVSGGDQPAYTTNTVISVASQDGQNTFDDDDTITIEQNVYYVNDTAGWTEENHEEMLAEEFGNSTDSSGGNSTSLTPANSTSMPETNSTTTEEGDGGDNSTAMMSAMSFGSEEEAPLPTDDNDTATTSDISYEAPDEEEGDVQEDSTAEEEGDGNGTATVSSEGTEEIVVKDTGDNSTGDSTEASPPAAEESGESESTEENDEGSDAESTEPATETETTGNSTETETESTEEDTAATEEDSSTTTTTTEETPAPEGGDAGSGTSETEATTTEEDTPPVDEEGSNQTSTETTEMTGNSTAA